MKNAIYKVLSLAVLILSISACSVENQGALEGVYSGTFTVEYDDDQSFSLPVVVTFSGVNTFHCSINKSFTAGENGVYERSKSTIVFDHNNNIVLTHIDPFIILDGAYDYSLEENKLVLKAHKKFGVYTYVLTKQ